MTKILRKVGRRLAPAENKDYHRLAVTFTVCHTGNSWDKKAATALMTASRVIMPKGLSLRDGLINSIREAKSSVKLKFNNVTETQNSKNGLVISRTYFCDWENHQCEYHVKERSFPKVTGSSAKGGALGGKTSFNKKVPQESRTVK